MVGESFSFPTSDVFTCANNGLIPAKKKRKPAGTPDPDAEVIYLSPELLMESDRFVCEICNQSFQREQNLQMHRRRHKVPWKLLKRETEQVRKRVYVCPEPTCLHHDPCHALGDLVGIKKHFKRKHSNKKQWVCDKCSKGYAVHSDLKAHLKICGTRGHSCDCGRVFSRVEAFIEHQDTCKPRPANFVQVSSATTTPSDNFLHSSLLPYFPENQGFSKNHVDTVISGPIIHDDSSQDGPSNNVDDTCNFGYNLELQLFSSSSSFNDMHLSNDSASAQTAGIRSVRPFVPEELRDERQSRLYGNCPKHHPKESLDHFTEMPYEAHRLRCEAQELSMIAMEQKALAEEKHKQAKRLIGLAMEEMAKAKEIKEQALAEFNAAQYLKACATSRINPNMLHIKCNACRREFQMMSQEKRL